MANGGEDSGTKTVELPKNFDQWTSRFGVKSKGMMRKVRGAQKDFNKRIPYLTKEQWDQKLKQVKEAAVPVDKKKPAYEKLGADVLAERKRLKEDLSVESGEKDKIDSMLQGVYQRLSAQRYSEENAESIEKGESEAKVEVERSEEGEEANQKFKDDAVERRKKKTEGASLVANRANAITSGTDKVAVPFSKDKVTELYNSTNAEDSEFKSVLLAMQAFRETDENLRAGISTYAEFTQKLNAVRAAAEQYKSTHASPKTKDGKARVAGCDDALKSATDTQRLVSGKNDEIHKLVDGVAALAKADKANAAMIFTLENLKKFPYAGTDTKSHIDKVIKDVRIKLAAKAEELFAQLENPTDAQRAEILLECGGCKPPGEKGQSDSFFIKGTDGSNAFIFKPNQGEARQSLDWPEGGGAPREILATRLNDLFQSDLGLDLKMPRTTLLKTEDESFRQGSKSKSTTRAGALQTAVQFKPGDPTDGVAFFGQNDDNTAEALASIDPEQAEAIGLMDFITLNGDRHSANMLVQNPGLAPGQTKLVPIDAGQMLPTKEAFIRGAGSMTSRRPYNPENPAFADDDNMLMQLPGAQQKFSKKTQDAIAKLDPEKMVEAMRVQYADLAREAPEMAGKVDESSFDLMKRSMMFLKKAAPVLTQYQISLVYAKGFLDIVNADEGDIDAQIDKAIDQVLRLVLAGGDEGADSKLGTAGFGQGSDTPVGELTIEQKVKILETNQTPEDFKQQEYVKLQASLADLPTYLQFNDNAAFRLADELTRPYSKENYKFLSDAATYKKMGGDPRLKAMLTGDDATFNLEVRKPLKDKMGRPFRMATDLVKFGGYTAVRAAMGDKYAAIAGKDVFDQVIAYEKFMKG